MKAMLISEMLEASQEIQPFLKDYDFDLIHYRSPLKAMDNIEEISPDAIVINAVDFPRHWKVIAQYVNWNIEKENIIILLVDENFSEKEADKAATINIQGIIKIKESLTDILPKLTKIFKRYEYSTQKKENKKNLDLTQLLFINPKNGIIITGLVKNIKETGISFIPDTPANVSNLQNDTIIKDCSLQVNTKNISVNCLVKSNNKIMELSFLGIPPKFL